MNNKIKKVEKKILHTGTNIEHYKLVKKFWNIDSGITPNLLKLK